MPPRRAYQPGGNYYTYEEFQDWFGANAHDIWDNCVAEPTVECWDGGSYTYLELEEWYGEKAEDIWRQLSGPCAAATEPSSSSVSQPAAGTAESIANTTEPETGHTIPEAAPEPVHPGIDQPVAIIGNVTQLADIENRVLPIGCGGKQACEQQRLYRRQLMADRTFELDLTEDAQWC